MFPLNNRDFQTNMYPVYVACRIFGVLPFSVHGRPWARTYRTNGFDITIICIYFSIFFALTLWNALVRSDIRVQDKLTVTQVLRITDAFLPTIIYSTNILCIVSCRKTYFQVVIVYLNNFFNCCFIW